MSTFKFNFELEDDQPKEDKSQPPLKVQEKTTVSPAQAEAGINQLSLSSASDVEKGSRAKEITVTDLHWFQACFHKPYTYHVPRTTDLQLYYLNTLGGISEAISKLNEIDFDLDDILTITNEIDSNLKDPDFKLSVEQHSDLIPGVYEGGLKVWDGAVDLMLYLIDTNFKFPGTKVLELGCGVGLPGICALMKGADHVSFQDYNFEVINFATIPSVLHNLRDASGRKSVDLGMPQEKMKHDDLKKCRFFSGDWSHFTDYLVSKSCDHFYDVIITAETIYSEASQPKLLSAMKRLLNPKGGVAFVAAKTYYFGVGGTTRGFIELIRKDGYFDVSEVKVLPTSLPRKVLKLVPFAA